MMLDDDAICDYADYRLKMQLAEALEIVRAVAYSDPFNGWYPAVDAPPGVVCRWCKAKALIAASVRHAPDCMYGHAQRLVSALLHDAQELTEREKQPVPEFVARAVDRLPALPSDDDDDDDIEAERMAEQIEIDRACELSRLRDGIGTPDELADYAAAREMILDGE